MDRRVSTPLVALVLASWMATVMARFDVPTLAFGKGYSPLFGDLDRSDDDRNVRIILHRNSGAGFISTEMYHHGLFSASIKLPPGYTAGVVVAFYTSNSDVFERGHDEIDFEFLGNVLGEEWLVQTNVYGNGSVNRGREERYVLPFDPTEDFHRYSILWTTENIIFYIDDTPIREVRQSEPMRGEYPSKPMSLYATIWDASEWATAGGRHKVDYDYAPFISEFTGFALLGCRLDPLQKVTASTSTSTSTNLTTTCSADGMEQLMATGLAFISPKKRQEMYAFRKRFMTYSFCHDTNRYPITFPDCNAVEWEKRNFRDDGSPYQKLGRRSNRAKRAERGKRAKSHQY